MTRGVGGRIICVVYERRLGLRGDREFEKVEWLLNCCLDLVV